MRARYTGTMYSVTAVEQFGAKRIEQGFDEGWITIAGSFTDEQDVERVVLDIREPATEVHSGTLRKILKRIRGVHEL